MRLHSRLVGLVGSTMMVLVGTVFGIASIPPGRQHRLSIEGENTITFRPQANLPVLKIDYNAHFEYVVNTWFIKESKTPSDSPKGTNSSKNAAGSNRNKVKGKDGEAPAKRASREVDVSLHSAEVIYRQNGQSMVETKMSRSRFQGRLQPDSPVLSVSAKEAPPRLQELLKIYDTQLASMWINDDDRVVDTKLKIEGNQRPVVETILSIHSPMPKDLDTWEASSRLAMGHGQTARGKLRFQRIKKLDQQDTTGKPGDHGLNEVIQVKVTGVLKGEGVVAGNLIKDGTYTVDGEQSYDPQTREWITSRWSVEVNNELANQAGLTVAQARGRMRVESRAVKNPGSSDSGETPPKL